MVACTIMLLLAYDLIPRTNSFTPQYRFRSTIGRVVTSVASATSESSPNARIIIDQMIATQDHNTIRGLSISIGPTQFGLGLYVSVSKDVGCAHVPRGSIICDYLGEFDFSDRDSDKAVGFGFWEEHDIHSWVYYDDQLVHLWQAVHQSSEGEKFSLLREKLEGHVISVDNGDIQITKNPMYNKTRFVPMEESATTPLNFAKYANDKAFQLGVTKSASQYLENYNKNCLMLVWKLAKNHIGILEPINPVLVAKTDLIFRSETSPIEITVGYGWDYWIAELAKQEVRRSKLNKETI